MKRSLVAVLVSLVSVLSACGVDPADSTVTPAPSASTNTALETAFTQASREYQVPVAVLKSIAWVETRLSTRANLESGTGGVGVMQLSRRDGVDTLGRAAALTGVTEGRLRVDSAANVRGAAAVLRALFDDARRSQPVLDSQELGDWYVAVSYYPGFDSVVASTDYAADVFLALEQGFTGNGVVQAPLASSWRTHAPVASARRDGVVEYPGAVGWVASPNFTSGRSTYEFVLIHTMQGSYAGTKSWFQNPNSNVSSHYIVRSSDGQITQMVEHKNTAWHAQCYNGRSVGIEHEGFVNDPATWYTDAMYTESAKLTRWIADRHNIPRNRSHIIGHAEVPSQCNTGGHTDPGSGWNWTKYMNLVNGSTPTTTTGVLIGAIYTGGNSANRVSGATVTVGSQTVTTGANGLYQFTLAPGSYTATVSKSGFAGTSVTRTVTAGTQTWGSMEINASAATGVLRGKIFAYNAADPTNMNVAITGATVTAGGQTQTTAADGAYLFNLAPGTYTVNVTKSGYVANQVSRTVAANATVWGSVGLSTTNSADTQAPMVAISFPSNMASLDLGRIDLKGTASDDRGAVATVKVALNGGASTDVPVTNGAFQVEVQLKPGTNSIEVTAVDGANNTGRATSTATFNAGVAGFVSSSADSSRLEGVSIELREASSGTVVSTVMSDAGGAYYAPVMVVPADYLVVVKKTGFLTHSETVTVPADARLALDLVLTPGIDEVAAAELTFVEPADESTVNAETVTIFGTVTGVDLIGVTLNDVSAELLGGGGFSATVPLVEGKNVITATATATTGQTLTATLTLYRKTGATTQPSMVKGGCGGCSGVGAEPLLVLALGALFARRRR
ncbi:MAG: N-acetylmuramoyl-L-alanine amidase [Myxococcaceae bacterium]